MVYSRPGSSRTVSLIVTQSLDHSAHIHTYKSPVQVLDHSALRSTRSSKSRSCSTATHVHSDCQITQLYYSHSSLVLGVQTPLFWQIVIRGWCPRFLLVLGSLMGSREYDPEQNTSVSGLLKCVWTPKSALWLNPQYRWGVKAEIQIIQEIQNVSFRVISSRMPRVFPVEMQMGVNACAL